MGAGSPPYRFEDQITVSLRWLALFGLTLSLYLGKNISPYLIVTVLLAALWNASLTVMVAFGHRLPAHHYLAVGVDMAFAYLLFYLSGALNGAIGWAGLLPVMTASQYFGLRGGLVVALVSLLVQGTVAYPVSGFVAVLAYLATLLPLYVIVALIFGLLSQRIQARITHPQAASRSGGGRADVQSRGSLYQLVSALSSSLNYQRVLDTALDLSTGALEGGDGDHQRIVCAVLLYADTREGVTELRVGSARRFTHADMRKTLPGTTGLIGGVFDGGYAQPSGEVASDPELGRLIAMRTCKSAYCIPLRSGLDTYGVLLYAHPAANFFSPERREVLDIIGNQATIAIQNARLYRELEQEKERMMEIQEEARNKLARDLHDGPTQTVAAIAMRVNFARRLLERDPKSASEELYKIEELARRTTKEIRHMLFTLRPLVLESQGLVPALESMADKMRETYGQDVRVAADAEIVSQIELGKQGVIFYIVEEAVNNARKHAQAAQIWVRLGSGGDELALLEIEDNGVGFDPQAVDSGYENRGSMGMVNMRERTELLNGHLRVDSKLGQGTRISIIIPLTEGAAERMRRGQ